MIIVMTLTFCCHRSTRFVHVIRALFWFLIPERSQLKLYVFHHPSVLACHRLLPSEDSSRVFSFTFLALLIPAVNFANHQGRTWWHQEQQVLSRFSSFGVGLVRCLVADWKLRNYGNGKSEPWNSGTREPSPGPHPNSENRWDHDVIPRRSF